MAILFESGAGRVVRLNDPAAQAQVGFMAVGGGRGITFENQLSIITRMTMSHQVNVQFLHTIGAHIYIYVFGDRIGSLSLSGLAFQHVCDKPGESGAAKMYAWYKANRASKIKDPLRVTIGDEVIEGFVVAFNEDVVDPSIDLVQWNVQLVSLPADN